LALASGARLGPYEVLALLGSGGMGEVYRARDAKLGRDVAIKVLPDALAGDPERLARFEREAKTLAALNHPNIAAIYGLEESAGLSALVMELVEGEDLSQRIARGPIPLDEALPIAKQIADALEAAHEQGIIHRDLKPANIKVRADGTVKVLDFGLAKAMEPAAGSSSSMSMSPTLTTPAMMTGVGMILGTAAYMSPEQAKGRAADKRSDVWAFGCVVFEMLSQHRAFAGEDVSDTLAGILRGEPNWAALPARVPAQVRGILERCLDKDRRTRIPDMSVVRYLLATAPAAATAAPLPSARARIVAWTVAAAFAAAFVVVLWSPWRKPPPPPPVTRFTIAPPGALLSAATTSGPIAISPDGRRIAFVAQSDSGTRMLQVRELDRFEPRWLRETEGTGGVSGAGYPFFSADGQSIGFVAGSAIKRVPVGGGPAATISQFTGAWRGATWLPDDTIVVSLESPERTGLFRVPATGGAITPVAQVEKGELAYRWPDALPGGKAIVFANQPGGDSSAGSIVLLRLDTHERRVLVEGGSYPRYVSSGHIVFARNGTLLAVPFDLATLRVTGAPVPMVPHVTMATTTGQAQYDVSQSGTLVYANLSDENGPSLVWVDRKGGVQPIPVPPQGYEHPRLSPDGQRLAVDIRGYGGGASTDIWVYTFARGTLSRLTFVRSESEAPTWTPDGKYITYSVSLEDRPPRGVARKLADNSGEEELLARGEAHLHALQWNPRGDVLLLNESATSTSDVHGLFMSGKPELRQITHTPFKEASAAFSPDGRWMAYASDETGRFEVYMQAFPGPGGKTQISINGGVEPVWARSGRELFFRDGDKMMSVAMGSGGAPAGVPAVLFQGRFVASTSVDRWYDVSPDGQRFLMLRADAGRAPATLTVVQEWASELAHAGASRP
jgi:eukaryotic-like serine/threonine-protein kinase